MLQDFPELANIKLTRKQTAQGAEACFPDYFLKLLDVTSGFLCAAYEDILLHRGQNLCEEQVMIYKLLVNAAFLAIGYYIGKEVGLSEQLPKDTEESTDSKQNVAKGKSSVDTASKTKH
jgi:hypothetical protein